jgi:hypothetical protein
MFRIDQDGAVAVIPAPAPLGATPGFFTEGNPGLGQPATQVTADWLNAVQEELIAVALMNGGALDKAVRTQLRDAILAGVGLPLEALPFPTVATSDHRIGAIGAIVGGTGGTVSIAAGTRLTLGQEIVAGQTARLRTFTTAAYASPNLDTASTYFLRAQVDGAGALVPYVQKGTDADAIPAGLKGTPGGANGGGFDSTAIDILLAKVVTGAAGTMPTITNLANAASLAASIKTSGTPTQSGNVSLTWTPPFALNWARTPRVASFHGGVGSGNVVGGHLEGNASYITQGTITRYGTSNTSITADWSNGVALTSNSAELTGNFLA